MSKLSTKAFLAHRYKDQEEAAHAARTSYVAALIIAFVVVLGEIMANLLDSQTFFSPVLALVGAIVYVNALDARRAYQAFESS